MRIFKEKIIVSAMLASVALTASAGLANAGCGLSAGRVSIVGNEFPAIHTVADNAAKCAGDGVTVKATASEMSMPMLALIGMGLM